MTVSVFPRVIRDGLVIDFDPASDRSFNSRENRLTYSDQLDNAAWTKDNCTVTSNAIIAPDGTLTGDTLVSTITGGNNNAYIQQVPAGLPTNTVFTYSVYLRRGTSPTSLVDFFIVSPYTQVTATVTWGATPSVVYGFGGGATSGTLLASSFTQVENEWYRVSMTISTGSGTSFSCRVYVRSQSTNNVSGETSHVWGAQLERARNPSIYTATTVSAVTRGTSLTNQVSTSFPGTINGAVAFDNDSVGSFYFNNTINDNITLPTLPDTFWNASSWTVSAWAKFNSVASDNGIIGHGGASTNNGLHLGTRGVNVYYGFFGNDASSANSGNDLVVGRWYHMVWVYDFAQKQKLIYVNGRIAFTGSITGAAGYAGTGTNTALGYYPWSGSQQGPLNGWLGRVQMYNRVLSASEVSQIFSSLAGRHGYGI